MIDLCVVNFRTPQLLKRLLDTLHEDYAPDVWRLYIADNGSNDGSDELLKQWETEYQIEYVFYNENIGYARACNQLAAEGTGDIVALLNADVWLKTADVRKIQVRFDNTDVAVLGPKQRDERGRVTHGGIFGTHSAPRHRGWLVDDPRDSLYRDLLPAITVSGSAYFVRSSVWNDLTACETYRLGAPEAKGAFLPTDHYYEETWCSYHAAAHGYSVMYDGTVSIGHTWHASSEVNGEQDRKFNISRETFRNMCKLHDIECD